MIRTVGIFSRPEPVEADLPDGRRTLHFKQPSMVAMLRYIKDFDRDDESRIEAMLDLIAASWCDAAGKLLITPEQARDLTPEAAIAIFKSMPIARKKR